MRFTQGIAAILLALGCFSPLHAETLQTATAELRTVEREQTFDAVIEAVHQATVSSQTSGRITNIYFDVDDYVEKDEILIRFRDKAQRAELKAASAKYQEAEAEFKRAADLLQKKLVAQAMYDKAEAGYKAAKAALEQAQERLAYTVVRAPYSGIVVKRHVEPGEMANPGQPLITGLSLEKLRVVANVTQQHIDAVRSLKRAHILLPTRDSMRLEAAKLTISPYADPSSHTFKVRVDMPEGDHGVYPGMFAKAVFVTGEEQRLVVPRQAVVYRSEVTAAYVVSEDGRIRFRQLRLGRRLTDGNVEVLAGLEAGEKVALDPIRAGVLLKQQRAGE